MCPPDSQFKPSYAFFVTTLYAFLSDAAPTSRRVNKIMIFVGLVANVIRFLVLDIVNNHYGLLGSDKHQQGFGFLLPMMVRALTAWLHFSWLLSTAVHNIDDPP
jgi:hypothetical protein